VEENMMISRDVMNKLNVKLDLSLQGPQKRFDMLITFRVLPDSRQKVRTKNYVVVQITCRCKQHILIFRCQVAFVLSKSSSSAKCIHSSIHPSIHSVVCLKAGPQPVPSRFSTECFIFQFLVPSGLFKANQ
jgi:hypothetical protein